MANPPLRSMTGFARARRPLGDGELVVSVKTLNHRSLDVHVHAPSVADPFENAVRALVKSRLARGHVEVRISLPPAAVNGNSAKLNRTLLEEYLGAFNQAAAEHGLDARPDLNAALRIPGMFGEAAEGSELPAGTEAAMLDALGAALDELNQFRAREGAEIAQEMSGTQFAARRARGGDGKDSSGRAGGFPKPAHRAPQRSAQGRARSTRKGWPRKPRYWPIAAISAKN